MLQLVLFLAYSGHILQNISNHQNSWNSLVITPTTTVDVHSLCFYAVLQWNYWTHVCEGVRPVGTEWPGLGFLQTQLIQNLWNLLESNKICMEHGAKLNLFPRGWRSKREIMSVNMGPPCKYVTPDAIFCIVKWHLHRVFLLFHSFSSEIMETPK